MRSIFGKPGLGGRAVLFAFLMLLYGPQFSFARDTALSLGLNLEGNMNTVSRASAASGLSLALDLGRFFAAGLKTGYSHNFSGIGTLETAALGRWYFLSVKQSRLFVQAEAGAALIFYDGKTIPAFLGSLALGWRIALGDWYLEPALRGGYPHIWGAGLGFGVTGNRSGEPADGSLLLRRTGWRR